MNTLLDFSQKEWENMKRLIDDFQSYYEDSEEPWSFDDLDSQREIACELIWLLADKMKNA
jgi:hypothetical protein